MLYLAYQTHADIMQPVRSWALAGLRALGPWANGDARTPLRNLTAAYELIARAGLTHVRPPYAIDAVRVGNREVAVTEHRLASTPFGTLLHFKKDAEVPQPRVLVVAPLSGHFATLLRSLVRTLLPEHDVCITDWHNARDFGTVQGRFGFDDYTAHLIEWLETMGSGAHVVAVCQPCVQVLAAAAVMAEGRSPAQPRSMTLMAAPSMRASTRPRSTHWRQASRSNGSSRTSLPRCRGDLPARGARSIPDSCSSPLSCR